MINDEQEQWDKDHLREALINLEKATSGTSQPQDRAKSSHSLGMIRGILIRRGLYDMNKLNEEYDA